MKIFSYVFFKLEYNKYKNLIIRNFFKIDYVEFK